MSDRHKRKVLFLCTGNSARSIMGEYLLRSMDSRFATWSAGAEPTGRVHPVAVQVLREVYGIDATGAVSKSWQAVAGVDFDVVITVCDHARDTCPILPGSSAIVAHWGSEDPARAGDAEAEAAFRRGAEAAFRRGAEAAFRRGAEAAFRRVAAEIYRRLERFCALPWDQLEREVPPEGDQRNVPPEGGNRNDLTDRLRRIGAEG